MKKTIFILISLLITATAIAQERVLSFGLQFKPIVPSSFFRSGSDNIVQGDFSYMLKPKFGYSAGMVIRKGFDKTFSFETGINFIRRNYALGIEYQPTPDSSNTIADDFSIIGYEIPLLGLVNIRLGEQIYMNSALGLSLDLFPSAVKSKGDYYFHQSSRNSWVQTALLANVGFELRTKKSGIFYIGASFHRPFTYTYKTEIRYYADPLKIVQLDEMTTTLSGNYLTFDFRYFFHENPEKNKVKTKKEKKKGMQ